MFFRKALLSKDDILHWEEYIEDHLDGICFVFEYMFLVFYVVILIFSWEEHRHRAKMSKVIGSHNGYE